MRWFGLPSDLRVSLGERVADDAVAQVLESLDGARVIVRVGPYLHPLAATAGAALFCLLARLHAHVTLDGDAPLGPNPWQLRRLSELPDALAGVRPSPTREPVRTFIIGLGETAPADLFVGGDDWTAHLAPQPRPLAPQRTGLGVQAAATLAAAEVAKMCLGPLGMIHHRIDGALVWNLADYRRCPAPQLEAAAPRSLAVSFFGGGSVGSSAIGALCCVPDLEGFASVVDPDTFDPSHNPYRYPILTGRESDPKAGWLARRLIAGGWHATAHPERVGSWVRRRVRPGFDGIAVSSVDRVDARLEVADVLARTTLSVGVAGSAFHLQRECSFDEYACPFCQFASLASPLSQAEVYAAMTGLSPERVVQLVLGAPLRRADLEIAVSAAKLSSASAATLAGRRFEDLVRRTYAEARVHPSRAAPLVVSTPHVSWMAGVLVAAELVKAATSLPMIDRRLDLDLAGVPTGAVRRVPRDAAGRCVCASPFRRRWARRLYGG